MLANIRGCLWLIWWTARGSGQIAPQQTTHIWDDDLTEYNNPLPRWWLWLFILSIVFALGYLVFTPVSAISRARALDRSFAIARRGSGRAAGARAALCRLQRQESGRAVAGSRRHGDREEFVRAQLLEPATALTRAAPRAFPNLTDQDWLWGGSEQTIYQTIAQGRDGMMPAWGPVLGHDGVEQVLAYVLSLSGRQPTWPRHREQTRPPARPCSRPCARRATAPTATAIRSLGAPNLTDKHLAVRRLREGHPRDHHHGPHQPHARTSGAARRDQGAAACGLCAQHIPARRPLPRPAQPPHCCRPQVQPAPSRRMISGEDSCHRLVAPCRSLGVTLWASFIAACLQGRGVRVFRPDDARLMMVSSPTGIAFRPDLWRSGSSCSGCSVSSGPP